MEKVITECRVVETDDGFRVEVKGDKEAMRTWMKHFRPWRRMRRARRFAFDPCGPFGWHHGFGHWGHEEGAEPEQEKEE